MLRAVSSRGLVLSLVFTASRCFGTTAASMSSHRAPLVREPKGQHQSTVIFLHGLGDSGDGWSFLGQMLGAAMPNTKWVFPHANSHPVTLNGGMRMPSWYDIVSLTDRGSHEDRDGLERTASYVLSLIEAEVSSGIPSSKIVLGGFSQGAASTHFVSLTTDKKLAGFVALSGYLPLFRTVFASAPMSTVNNETPRFCGHGTADPVVRFEYGAASAKHLESIGVKDVTMKSYSGAGHTATEEEVMDVAQFLRRILY